MDSIDNGQFRSLLCEAVGTHNACIVIDALQESASVSVRINPFKYKNSHFCLNTTCDLPSSNCESSLFGDIADGGVSWNEDALFLKERPVFTLDPLFHTGLYYVQDSSAMFPGWVLGKILSEGGYVGLSGRPFRVLDLCAAPGGKTTDISVVLRKFFGENFLAVSNEVMKPRARALADNVAVWGDPNVLVTNLDPSAFSGLQGYFDLIIADVPCSGEGMFRKDRVAVAEWSKDTVDLCAARQKRIIADVWNALAPEGILIYSTCTFNKYENDDNAEWISKSLGADILQINQVDNSVFKTQHGFSLLPGLIRGEGQYCSALRKTGGNKFNKVLQSKNKKSNLNQDFHSLINIEAEFTLKSDNIIAIPKVISEECLVLEDLRPIRSGVAIGQVKGKILVPDSDFALSYIIKQGAYPTCEVDKDTAIAFLHKDTIILPNSEKGYLIIKYKDYPLGFVKNLGNRCNNLHSLSRRIRMDI